MEAVVEMRWTAERNGDTVWSETTEFPDDGALPEPEVSDLERIARELKGSGATVLRCSPREVYNSRDVYESEEYPAFAWRVAEEGERITLSPGGEYTAQWHAEDVVVS